jgi:hypothetical protein
MCGPRYQLPFMIPVCMSHPCQVLSHHRAGDTESSMPLRPQQPGNHASFPGPPLSDLQRVSDVYPQITGNLGKLGQLSLSLPMSFPVEVCCLPSKRGNHITPSSDGRDPTSQTTQGPFGRLPVGCRVVLVWDWLALPHWLNGAEWSLQSTVGEARRGTRIRTLLE